MDSLLHICRVEHPTYSQSWQNNLFTHPNFMKFVDFFGNSNNFYLYNSPNANTAIENNNMKAINHWNNHNVINPGEIKNKSGGTRRGGGGGGRSGGCSMGGRHDRLLMTGERPFIP